MKTGERIRVSIEHGRILEMGVIRRNDRKIKQNKAFVESNFNGYTEEWCFFTEEQLQDLLDGLTIVKNELHKRNSSKRQKKKKPASKPKKEIEVQMFLINPIPIL